MKTKHMVIINSGSSSIKFAVYEFSPKLNKLLNGQVENITTSPVLKIYDSTDCLIKNSTFNKNTSYEKFYELLLSAFESNEFNYDIVSVGHRIVHGGAEYQQPVLVTDKVVNNLKKYIPFAPLHQPYNIQAIECVKKLYPKVAQVACFDTAFHHTHPLICNLFGLPKALTDEGIRRYGFHGLSYEYIMHKFKQLYPDKINNKIIIAHLGNGCSMCAIYHGKSVDSTMGLTTLDGLLMGTRCGTLDPGVVIYLMKYHGMTANQIENLLYTESGLLGVSGITNDMKELLEDKSDNAKLAVDLFIYRARRELGALASVLGGVDHFIFTGGIGEHAWQIRERVCQNNEWLSLYVDKEKNTRNEININDSKSKVSVHVIPTDEEWMIAKHTYQVLRGQA